MKKLFLLLMVLALTIGCTQNNQQVSAGDLSEPTSTTQQDQTTTTSSTTQAYSRTTETGYISSRPTYQFNKDIMTISPTIKQVKLDFEDQSYSYSCAHIYDDKRVILSKDYQNSNNTEGLYLYEIESEEMKSIYQFNEEVSASIVASNQDYLLITEQYNNKPNVQLSLVNIATGKQQLVYDYGHIPEMTMGFFQDLNGKVAFNDNLLYFADLIEADDQPDKYVVFCYDIQQQKIIEQYDNYQFPVIYRDQIHAIAGNDNKSCHNITNLETGQVVVEFDPQYLNRVAANDSGIFGVIGQLGDINTTTKSQIVNLLTGDPILTTYYAIDELLVDNNRLMWSTYYGDYAYYYAINEDKIVKIEGVEPGGMYYYSYQNQLIILRLNHDEQSHQWYWLTL